MKKVIEAIEEKIGSIKADLETLNNLPEFSFEAIEEYKRTLDINKAIAEGQRLVDIQKRKEAAAAKEVPDERVAEEPAGCAHDDADKQWIGFEALLSIEDAKELRAFFNRNAINFRML